MNSIQTLLTDQLDLWTAADTEKKSGRGRSSGNADRVYGIRKLRELILELAVRGKLVPQDPNDEPASALLPKVLKENARLLKERNKKPNEAPEITDGEITFQLPKGWEYVRSGSLFSLRKGKKPMNISESEIGLPYLDIEALDRNNVLRFTDDDKCPRTTEADILVVCDGSRSGLVLEGKNGIIGSTLAVIDTPKLIQPFIKLLFKESYERMNSAMKGAAIPHLDTSRLILEVVGLPPLNEQYRIIAKVDELMALCDQLEQQQTHSIEAHQTLVETLLVTLTRVETQQEFNEAWARIANHFDTLFTTEASIDQLKQTILQLAVMGKLVPQDPNDESASALLKRIQAEKTRLIAEGKIKKDKLLPPITDDEKPFELPQGWNWARFPELGEFGRGKSKHRPRNEPKLFNPGIYPLVQTGEVARAGNVIDEYHSKYSEAGLAQSKMWPAGTLCITIAANIADSAMLGFDACFPDSVVGFIPCEPLSDTRYFLAFMKTARENLLKFAPSTAQKNINLEILESVLIPLPPLKEIFRIVAKVDELMALCDTLKARLADAQAIQLHLADAIVEQAVC